MARSRFSFGVPGSLDVAIPLAVTLIVVIVVALVGIGELGGTVGSLSRVAERGWDRTPAPGNDNSPLTPLDR
jgi:hypothetical protein